jgi:hypothetical protein
MTGLVVSYGVSRVYVVGALSYRPPGVPMKARFISGIVIGLALTLSASAQDAPAAPPAGSPSASPAQGAGPGGGQGGQGQRGGGRGGWGGGGMMGMGGGLMGTVTEAAADHFTIKTDAGEAYTVHFSVNTRMMKQGAGMRDRGERGQAGQNGQAGQARQGGEGGERGQGMGAGGGNPPQPIKPTDIKVGDAIAAMGEIDAAAKSVGATAILQIDPERAKQMREMQANYGKTWLMGKVTAIDGVKVTLMGGMDKAAHTFVADENTTFRKRREPITLADIQAGDIVRVEGAVKDGAFLATTVNDMGAQGQPPTVPRDAALPPQPK